MAVLWLTVDVRKSPADFLPVIFRSAGEASVTSCHALTIPRTSLISYQLHPKRKHTSKLNKQIQLWPLGGGGVGEGQILLVRFYTNPSKACVLLSGSRIPEGIPRRVETYKFKNSDLWPPALTLTQLYSETQGGIMGIIVITKYELFVCQRKVCTYSCISTFWIYYFIYLTLCINQSLGFRFFFEWNTEGKSHLSRLLGSSSSQ